MFPYIGGKSHHIGWMDPIFPKGCNIVVEVFGGAGWMTLKSRTSRQANLRIYNDANTYLANAWDCFVECPDQLLTRMRQDAPSNEQLYRQYQAELFGDQPISSRHDVQLASKYLYLQTQIFAGTPLSNNNVNYFVDAKSNGKYPSKYLTLQKKLANKKIVDAIGNVKVECMDYADLIAKYDGPNTFFYLDPPYYNLEFYYTHKFESNDHLRLAEVLRSTRGKWALSYYMYEGINNLYPQDDYEYHSRQVYRSASTRSSHRNDYSKSSRAQEILIVKH